MLSQIIGFPSHRYDFPYSIYSPISFGHRRTNHGQPGLAVAAFSSYVGGGDNPKPMVGADAGAAFMLDSNGRTTMVGHAVLTKFTSCHVDELHWICSAHTQ